MNNFGVIEVASTKTTHAPGWAYVPDTAASSVPSQSVSAVHLHVNRNKRAARQANSAGGGGGSAAQLHNDVSARHDAKLQKEIEQLQRDSFGGGGARDHHHHHAAQATGPGGGGGGGGGGRDKDGKIRGHTPNVRKILASQKTFANHLDDFDAWRKTQAEGGGGGSGGGGAAGSAGQSAAGTPVPSAMVGAGNKRAATGGGGGPAQKRGAGASSSRARTAASSSKNDKKSATPAPATDADVSMADAPPEVTQPEASTATVAAAAAPAEQQQQQPDSEILTPFTRFTPPPHPGDADPLLETWLPPLPTDDELRALIGAPPLSYHQARGRWTEDDRRYPARSFCEVCGYWGRVRCIKCGTRVCALDCLDVHREECITRYGL